MEQVPDHPIIQSMMKYGHPNGAEGERVPWCPICGNEAEEFYIDQNHKICGCDECMKTVEAWDFLFMVDDDNPEERERKRK